MKDGTLKKTALNDLRKGFFFFFNMTQDALAIKENTEKLDYITMKNFLSSKDKIENEKIL